jgi:hypothetical protein
MATSYSPSIPTSGLVLAWDAANPKSYPGSGATIYDLSGNNNNGTLVNTPGYVKSATASTNVITFTAASQQWMYSATPNMSSTTSTVIGAARYSAAVTTGRTINGYSNNWLMGHWDGTTLNYYAQGWISAVDNGPSDTNWRIYATLNNQPADSWALYANNSLIVNNSAGSQGPNGIAVGRYPAGTEYLTGEFGFVYVYNRILSLDEIQQVYNSMQSRYGL